MKHEKVLKKVEKYLGVKAQEGHNGKWYAQYKDEVVSWYASPPWNDSDGPLEASLYHTRRENDISDPYTDYFAGCHWDNVTQMLHSAKPPEPKFPVGCLVRGKSNKRATRQGYAGKTGLVRETGGYVKIQWLGESYPNGYNYGYPERDLELVSAA